MCIMYAGAVASALRQKINPDVYRSTNILGACERSKPREPFFLRNDRLIAKTGSGQASANLGTKDSNSGVCFSQARTARWQSFVTSSPRQASLNGSFEPSIYKNDHFTKTGSGQT